ncbi:MAG: putative polymerase subfamily sigma factor [Ilumatobacteraceae bacterium]|nr:putative polymerase subfamily sigma factor [Ilumatobacteraceae bacterium]MCU1389697.1 putative polymerase subfamily sigma factor [Ilumatobacteraceae bacterium]
MDQLDDAEVYRKYAAELMRYSAVLAGPSGAEDLLATAVLRALSSSGWREVDNQRAYLYRVVLHEALRARRTTDRRMLREIRAAVAPEWEPSPVDVDVLTALCRLTVRQRAVVFLIYWADLTPLAVAETIGSSERTVERELTKARQRLETLLS